MKGLQGMLMVKTTHRPKVQIMAEILDLCRKPQSKTYVMHRANLSWVLLQKYLSYLQSQLFLEIQHNSGKLVTTEEGLKFVSRWKDMIDLLLPTEVKKKKKVGKLL